MKTHYQGAKRERPAMGTCTACGAKRVTVYSGGVCLGCAVNRAVRRAETKRS